MLRAFYLGLVLACLGCAVPGAGLAAEPGSPDTSFGTGGLAFAGLNHRPLGRPGDAVESVAGPVRQPGGRLVAAGLLYLHASRRTVIFLAGFTSRGRLDPSFGNRGIVRTDVPGAVYSLARQPNGRLMVGGTLGGRMLFARYSPSGRLDRRFGRGGLVRISPGPGVDIVIALRPRAGGRILAAGATGARGALVELRSDGRLDRAFGHGGKVRLDLGPGREGLSGVVIDRQHRIVVSGSRGHTAFAARLTPRGALDRTFGTNGLASVPAAGGSGVAIDAQGRVLLTGGRLRSDVSPSGGLLVARFTTQGRLDGSYAEAGVLQSALGTGAGAIKLDPAGRALLVGYGYEADEVCAILARTSPDGVLDPTFGRRTGLHQPIPPDEPCLWDSQVIQPIGLPGGGFADLLLMPDGRIVVAGMIYPDLYLARYHG